MEVGRAPGEQCAGQRKRERKHGMLKFDHFEREAQTFPECGHFEVRAATILRDAAHLGRVALKVCS
jgi:hypothetical protein